jgi:predicted amidohydrolase
MKKDPGKIVKIAACQLPDLREDIDNALSYINDFARKAQSESIQLLCFPECFLQGYLINDHLARHHALDLSSAKFQQILRQLPVNGPMLVIGLITIEQGLLYNTAIVVHHGKLVGHYRKMNLLAGENIFKAGATCPIFEINGLRFGINICYDTNFPEAAQGIAAQDAHLIVCPANNMMQREKAEKFKYLHNEVRAKRCQETGLWLISSDVTGERNDRISYGPTSVIDPGGRIVAQVPLSEVGMISAEIQVTG